MKISIEIPNEFEIEFKTDKFKDFFSRVITDMNCLCGNYEKETAEMLIEAFDNSEVIGNDWTPVKDKLPEIGEDVIVTTEGGNVWNVCYGYAYESDEEPCFHEWDSEMWQCFKPDVVAWMKMPKAYELR